MRKFMAKMSFIEKLIVNNPLQVLFHKYFGANTLLKNTNLKEPALILEIGAGVGITASYILKNFSSSKIVATDYDQAQIDKAIKRNKNLQIKFQQADAANLLFADNTFDACFAILAFHHIENFSQAVKGVYRVLKSGGKLYVYDKPVNNWNSLHRYIHLSTLGVFTSQEFITLLKQSGFKVNVISSKNYLILEAIK